MVLQSTGVALLAALVILLIKRKTYVQFSFFFAYIFFSILSTLWLMFLVGNYLLYFKAFWTVEALDAILALFALHEAFRAVFI